jgi:lysophospholipase L1-like esterase
VSAAGPADGVTNATAAKPRPAGAWATGAAGGLLLGVALLCNEWVLGALADASFLEERSRRYVLRALCGTALPIGVLLIAFRGWIAARRAELTLALCAAFVSLAAFLAVDIALGLAAVRAGNPDEEIETLARPHPTLGWVPRPGTSHHRLAASFDVTYEIDADGFKAVPHRGEAEVQVFFFGDSYTFGHGVGNRDTWSNLLAREHFDDRVHIFNAGVNAYGLAQMYGRLLELQDRLREGDVVVFSPIAKDLRRNIVDFVFIGQLVLRRDEVRVEHYPFFRDGELGTAPLQTMRNRIKASLLYARFSGDLFKHLRRGILSPPRVRKAHEIFAAARAVAESRRARFALVFLPQVKELRRGRYSVDVSSFDHRDIRHFFPADEHALEALQFPDDSHYSRAGHALVARALATTLLEAGYLDPKYRRGAR